MTCAYTLIYYCNVFFFLVINKGKWAGNSNEDGEGNVNANEMAFMGFGMWWWCFIMARDVGGAWFDWCPFNVVGARWGKPGAL